MTKTFHLNAIDDHWYGEGATKMVCGDFIRAMIGRSPDKVTAVVSDTQFEDAIPVGVRRNGFYRWSWRLLEGQQEHYGMRRAVEDVLGGMFNRINKDKEIICEPVDMAERTVWLRLF